MTDLFEYIEEDPIRGGREGSRRDRRIIRDRRLEGRRRETYQGIIADLERLPEAYRQLAGLPDSNFTYDPDGQFTHKDTYVTVEPPSAFGDHALTQVTLGRNPDDPNPTWLVKRRVLQIIGLDPRIKSKESISYLASTRDWSEFQDLMAELNKVFPVDTKSLLEVYSGIYEKSGVQPELDEFSKGYRATFMSEGLNMVQFLPSDANDSYLVVDIMGNEISLEKIQRELCRYNGSAMEGNVSYDPIEFDDLDDFGDHVAGPLQKDAVADLDVEASDLFEVVQRGAGYGDAGAFDRVEFRHGREDAGAADLHANGLYTGRCLPGREFIGDRPAGAFERGPQPFLLLQGIHLDNDPVNLVRDSLSLGFLIPAISNHFINRGA